MIGELSFKILPLPQDYFDAREISPNNCDDALNSPVVGVRRLKNPRNLLFSNQTNIELAITIAELVLVCNATYPIEWVFSSTLVSLQYLVTSDNFI